MLRKIAMTPSPSPLFPLPWLVSAAVLAIGIVWRDCVLIASSAMLAWHAFHVHMDSAAPWQGLRAALRCWLMGAAGIAAALALWLMVAAAQWDWWAPENDHALQTLFVLAAAAAACWIARPAAAKPGLRPLADVWVPLTIVAALFARAQGWQAAPCVFAAAVGAGVGWAGWRMSRHVAGELLAAGSRS